MLKLRLSNLWRWEGAIDRGTYALAGTVLFAIKYNLDRLVAALVFGRTWSVLSYWSPDSARGVAALTTDDWRFLGTLLALALPFVWVGLVLTARRLRSARLPLWLVTLFFVPVANLLFFAALCVLPSRDEDRVDADPDAHKVQRFLLRAMPVNPLGSAALAIVLVLPLAVGATWLGTVVLRNYGWSLFVGLPFCLGMVSVLIYAYACPRGWWSCFAVATLAVVLVGAALLVLAFEGLICLIMAAPIWLVFAWLGGAVGFLIQMRMWRRAGLERGVALFALAMPALMWAEHTSAPEPPLFAVRTSIVVNATPARVWQNVVRFAEMPPPREWLFRVGVAYPMRAEIRGSGVGAERHCVFSTGAFVEPIEVWNEPRLLKFSVTSNPAPMQEWTPYANVHPPHLDGFLVSRGGQFLLTALPDGRTRLEGTTWYHHNMWPANYWRVWSDIIIHGIHLRVLRHIKNESEA